MNACTENKSTYQTITIKAAQYYLMHKNHIAEKLFLDMNDGKLVDCEILDERHAPIGHRNRQACANWWERRAIPKHQKNQSVLLNGINHMVYMMQNLSLSLIDGYWIKPAASSLTWEDVNLYDHNFAEKDFHYADLANISPFKPSATTQGELQKRWVIIDGVRFLIKGNYGDMYRQSLNEVFVSDVHLMQGFDHVKYDKINLPSIMGRGIGCISPNFTSPDLEFIPAYDITFYDKQPNHASVLQHYIDTCVSLGISRDIMQHHMDYMILSDFLFTNTDRHLLNLGILRDPEALHFIKPAPLFDTGNCMFFNGKYSESTILDVAITSFYKTERKMLEQVKDRNALDLSKIPDPTELGKWYDEDPYSVVYLDNIKAGYAKKIELIEAYQRGYSLNPKSQNYYAVIAQQASDDEHNVREQSAESHIFEDMDKDYNR